MKKEKLKPWKEYCNLTPFSNPWNIVYKLALNKTKRSQAMTNLQRLDSLLTTDL
jgi:hypothetical protein